MIKLLLLLTIPFVCMGIDEKEYSILLDAMAIAESGGNSSKINYDEMAFGAFQIRKIYVKDVNRILGQKKYSHEDAFDNKLSIEMIRVYWSHYCTEKRIGRVPVMEDYARIHCGGPNGWKKKSSEKYWNKVKKYMGEENE